MNYSTTIKPIPPGEASVVETLVEALNSGLIFMLYIEMPSYKTVRWLAEMANANKRSLLLPPH